MKFRDIITASDVGLLTEEQLRRRSNLVYLNAEETPIGSLLIYLMTCASLQENCGITIFDENSNFLEELDLFRVSDEKISDYTRQLPIELIEKLEYIIKSRVAYLYKNRETFTEDMFNEFCFLQSCLINFSMPEV